MIAALSVTLRSAHRRVTEGIAEDFWGESAAVLRTLAGQGEQMCTSVHGYKIPRGAGRG